MAPQSGRRYRYYDLLMVAFVTVLLCANLIGAGKVIRLGGLTVAGGILFFPISYLFGDVLTEVYGYAQSRKVIWAGFAALAFSSLVTWVVLALPPAPGWPYQVDYERVLGSTPRIAIASLVAFFAGEFTNSYVLAKLKVRTGGRHLWLRTIGSTIVGEAVDTLVFNPLAFAGIWEPHLLLSVMVFEYNLKVAWEILATPITYRVVALLKAAESEDHYDINTQFSPFSLET